MSKKNKQLKIYEKNEDINTLAIDSHAHLDYYSPEELSDVLDNMEKDGLEYIIGIGARPNALNELVSIAKTRKNIYYCAGIHPYDALLYTKEYEENLINLSKTDKKFVGIGECGLDYHSEVKEDGSPMPTREEQKKAFIAQIKLACKLEKPIAMHIRDAHDDAIKILKEHKDYLKYGGIVHCYSGDEKESLIYQDLGLHISFSGSITYARQNHPEEIEKANAIIRSVAKDKFLIETDCPYLSPAPYRGQKNFPKMCLVVAEFLSNALECDVNKVIDQSNKNTKALFKI